MMREAIIVVSDLLESIKRKGIVDAESIDPRDIKSEI